MISEALAAIVKQLNSYVHTGYTGEPKVSATISWLYESTQSIKDMVLFPEGNIGSSAASFVNFNRENGSIGYNSHSVQLRFIVLFAPSHNDGNALRLLEKTTRFFQVKNVFAPGDTPALGRLNEGNKMHTQRIIFDRLTPSVEQVQQLWKVVGKDQKPCLVFRMRMLVINETGLHNGRRSEKKNHVVKFDFRNNAVI
jgi:hypothetical protein